jgi:hypothetical protein
MKPHLDVVRIETNLKVTLRRFEPRPFAPRYKSGKMRVAVYTPPAPASIIAGAQGLLQSLAALPNVVAAAVDSLSLGALLRYDVLVFPSCMQMPAEDLARLADVRRFVADYGGGLYVQHNSVGNERFPLHGSIFPEIASFAARRDSYRYVVAREHPLTAGHKVGEELEHMYYDQMTLDVTGASGLPVLVDAETKTPVVVAGQVGCGRVVLDGTIALASPKTPSGQALAAKLGKDRDFECPAYGFAAELLCSAVRWLCGQP